MALGELWQAHKEKAALAAQTVYAVTQAAVLMVAAVVHVIQAVEAQSASSIPARHAHSHQRIQETCNA
jgi:hypothetical protein